MELSIEEAEKMLSSYLELYHSLSISDVEISTVRGYWTIKKSCDDTCKHPIHGCIGNEGNTRHTISYAKYGRDEQGRFLSPYRVWDVLAKKGA